MIIKQSNPFFFVDKFFILAGAAEAATGADAAEEKKNEENGEDEGRNFKLDLEY